MSTNPHPRTPVEIVLDALAARGSKVRQTGPGQWSAQCPNTARHRNGDRNPSFSVHESPTGKAVINCHAGCTWRETVGALDLRASDLFPDEGPKVATIGPHGQARAVYRYTDEHGTLLFEVHRYVDKDGRKTFRACQPDGTWSARGVRRVLYNLPQVARAIEEHLPIWIVEGEKDAENLSHHVDGAVVTCNAFGAVTRDSSEWLPIYAATLDGAADVRIIADDDTPGRLHADLIARTLEHRAARVRCYLPAEGHKDISEHLGAGRGLDELRPLGAEPGDELDPEDTDWTPVDLTGIAADMIAGRYEPTVPTILAVRGALPLFYRGRINSLFGESGGGKTWVALAAIVERLRAGEHVLLIDYEDTPAGIVERLILLGATVDEIARLTYVNPATGIGLGIDALERADIPWTLAVIDSTGEAMAAGGIDPNGDADVARWFAVIKHLIRLPSQPAVCVLDHTPKDREAPSAFAIGSQRKRAAVTGAAYRVDTLKEPAKGRDGRLKLTVAKDRLGNRPKGSTAAIVDVRSNGKVELDFHLTEAQEAEAKGERMRPTVLMERVSRWLEINPGASQRKVADNVTGKTDFVRLALEVLVSEGWVTAETGVRGAGSYTVATPFREADDGLQPVDNSGEGSPRPTAPHRAPTAPRGAVSDRAPAPLPLQRGAVAGRGRAPIEDERPRPSVDNSRNPFEEDF